MSEEKSSPVYLNLVEVSEYLRLSRGTVCRLVDEEELPALKVGRSWRVRRDLLEDWIERRSGVGAS